MVHYSRGMMKRCMVKGLQDGYRAGMGLRWSISHMAILRCWGVGKEVDLDERGCLPEGQLSDKQRSSARAICNGPSRIIGGMYVEMLALDIAFHEGANTLLQIGVIWTVMHAWSTSDHYTHKCHILYGSAMQK